MKKAQKKKSILKPNIFDFHDYREFLSAYFSYLKKEQKISIRALSKSAGISHGYLSLVMKKSRNLSKKTLAKLLPHMDLTKQEENYLNKLIVLADSTSPEERNKVFKSLKGSSKYKESHPQEFETYKYLENWLHVAVRELALTKNFIEDPQWIKNQLPYPVRTKEVQNSIDFLLKHGFLKKNKKGKLVATDRNVECLGGVFQLSLGNFHRNMLQLAQEALTKYDRPQRKQIGYTMTLAKDDFDKVKDIIEDAKKKIKALEDNGKNSDTVYHVNFSAFPLAGEGCS